MHTHRQFIQHHPDNRIDSYPSLISDLLSFMGHLTFTFSIFIWGLINDIQFINKSFYKNSRKIDRRNQGYCGS